MTLAEVGEILVFYGALCLIVVLAMAVGDRIRPLDDTPEDET